MTDSKKTVYLIIAMGVSGSGKSTIAKNIARKFKFPFFEADDFHSEESKKWMAAGKPLNDEMREPWIQLMCDTLKQEYVKNRDCVLSYSGLRRSHRQRFRELGFKTIFIYLHGNKDILVQRLQRRKGHFMPSSLIDSQLDSMDAPLNEADIHILNISKPLPRLIKEAEILTRSLIKQ